MKTKSVFRPVQGEKKLPALCTRLGKKAIYVPAYRK